MQRCLSLARNGESHVSPNPMVGAVIDYNNEIIGEGYHQQYGQAFGLRCHVPHVA